MKTRITALITALIMVFAMPAAAFAGTAEPGNNASPMYNIAKTSSCMYFENYVDGYSVKIDLDMSVDMSMPNVCAVFENDVKRIEIYKQPLAGITLESYVNYTNRFLSDTNTYSSIYCGTENSENYGTVYITAFEREKINIENDRNYCVRMDVPAGRYAYSIFIKSSVPSYLCGGYEQLLESFTLTGRHMEGSAAATSPVDTKNRGWNDETLAFYEKYFAPDADLTWGIFEPDVDFKGFDQLNYYEQYLGYDFPILISYNELINTPIASLKDRIKRAYNHGEVLELTLQTTNLSSGNMMYNLLNGAYDYYIRDYAKVVAEFGHPVLFRLFNEMNGDWCPYSAYNTACDTIIFKEAYKHIYKIFEEEGALKNTIWVWNPNSVSYPNFTWNDALCYYPGDEYVDIVGMTAYNTGNYYNGEKWQSFTALYDEMYRNYIRWFGQPLMITEFASSSVGGDKAAWIKDMFKQIRNYAGIKVAIWWDGCDWDVHGNVARPYFLDETPQILNTFKAGMKVPWSRDIYA